MSRDYNQVAGQLAFPESGEPSPVIRRALRRGPRLRLIAGTQARPPAAIGQPSAPRSLTEWHAMTPGEQLTAWAGLRAWVTWLYDRYQLSVDDRLPRCWAQHPGLVEELYALKVWREEIYSAAQPSGQAARYWHSELRQVIHAATTIYAAGCRTGHRAAPAQAATDTTLQERWASASPLTGIPLTELAAAQRARRPGDEQLDHHAMAAAVDAGQARPLSPSLPDLMFRGGAWWVPVSAGWFQVADPSEAARLTAQSSLPRGDEN